MEFKFLLTIIVLNLIMILSIHYLHDLWIVI